MQKSLSAQICDAINSEDCLSIKSLFLANPEQMTANTFFGGQTWLGYASQVGKLASVKQLIESGAEVNQGSDPEGVTPLCSSCFNGHYDIAEYLLECGARLDTSASVRNALFAAIVGKSLKITKLLLEAGIDTSLFYNSKTMRNMDACKFALLYGQRDIARAIAFWQSKNDSEIAEKIISVAENDLEANRRGRKNR